MSVSPEEVERIAMLARLALAPEEAREMSRQLSSILGHMEALGRVRAEPGSEALGAPSGEAPLRRDEPGSDPLARAIPEIAPDWRDGFFVVPRLAALDADALNAEGGA